VRQASLYHHFATKDDILAALLEQTVTAPLELANRLAATAEPAAVRLYALLLFDSGQLMAGRWNLGALYLLPELRTERFSRFREERQQLRRRYREFATAVLAELGTDDESRAGLPFRIVETVINERSDAEGGGTGTGEQSPALLAEAGLRVLGWHDAESLRAKAERLLTTARST